MDKVLVAYALVLTTGEYALVLTTGENDYSYDLKLLHTNFTSFKSAIKPAYRCWLF